MPNLVFDQPDISLIDHQISAIKKFVEPQAVHPDAKLSTLELVNKYNYNGQLHEVITSDGYILELHRLIGRVNSSDSKVQKPIAFLMPGLMCSSSAWVVSGPEKGLAYILSDAGYDVWLGNARGTLYSRKHVSLSTFDKEYWDFSWHETGIRDLPAMIDHILETTGQEKLFYLGHSQGTTNFFVMATEMPEYQNKIQAMFAMAPVAYCGKVSSALMQLLARLTNSITTMMKLIGLYEFEPTGEGMKVFQELICREDAITQPFCSNMLFLITGFDKEQFNNTLLPIILGHAPAGASTKQMVHFAQLVKSGGFITSGEFRQFDYGLLYNKIKYGSFRPPIYDLKKIHVPVSLHYGSNDWIADVKDVDKLYTKLGNPFGKFRVPYDKFNHLDFLWAKDVKSLLYDKILSLMTHF
ncbi:Lipase 3 [Camponotus floridanus]|uniref:Lipase n=2 Tax=Camponotus floridanus TaxID=104421 RepID=E2A1A9_CAMFO|nr:Lipase 3 [Camponotus floridanus]